MKPIFLIPFLFLCSVVHSDPWGKDADLVKNPSSTSSITIEEKADYKIDSKGTALYETMIRFHQQVISPTDGPRSHFLPSSSQYTLDAMRSFGFLKGFILGCDRLMRENSDPWVYRTTFNEKNKKMKWDPVRK